MGSLNYDRIFMSVEKTDLLIIKEQFQMCVPHIHLYFPLNRHHFGGQSYLCEWILKSCLKMTTTSTTNSGKENSPFGDKD